MSRYFENSYSQILKEAASSSPTPGGGNVSAMVGCLGNAMVSMVANLTTGKEKYAQYQDQLDVLLGKSQNIMERLEELCYEDMKVFDKFMAAIKMPKESDGEKAARSAAMEAASITATNVPMAIAETCVEAVLLAEDLAPYGNKGAISDVGVGAYIAEAAMHGALLSAEINLGGIKDQEYVSKAREKMAALIKTAAESRSRSVAQVRERM